ncbi:MAG TPA: hypothetical protein VFL51_11145 [Pseudolabrys sp.]|nr:hypothetical protein [Pseudolabrys sp.]
MLRNRAIWAAAALGAALVGMQPAMAQSSGENAQTRPAVRHQARTRITVHPERNEPGPNSKRICQSWLEKEYRVSGTVIVPVMRCHWD